MKTVTSQDTDSTIREGELLGTTLLPGSVIALSGPLGSGKTTFVKGIARALGIKEAVTSPTFTIISEYEGTSLPLYHMDLYRISSEDEFEDTGGIELLSAEGVCVIEWPEHATLAIPENAVHIHIAIQEDGSRIITINGGDT